MEMFQDKPLDSPRNRKAEPLRNKKMYEVLFKQKKLAEDIFGGPLSWLGMGEKSHIYQVEFGRRNSDLRSKKEIEEAVVWLTHQFDKMQDVLLACFVKLPR